MCDRNMFYLKKNKLLLKHTAKPWASSLKAVKMLYFVAEPKRPARIYTAKLLFFDCSFRLVKMCFFFYIINLQQTYVFISQLYTNVSIYFKLTSTCFVFLLFFTTNNVLPFNFVYFVDCFKAFIYYIYNFLYQLLHSF